MTGLLILTFIPALAAVLFWLRMREQRREIDALRHQLGGPLHANDALAAERDLFGIVAHELRSPIAAILGYEELLSEGVLGPLEPRSTEALERIRSSALQLLALTDGMHVLSGRDSPPPEIEPVDFSAAFAAARARVATDAQARRVDFADQTAESSPLTGQGDCSAIDAILDAALGAVVKSSTERTLRTSVAAEGDRIHIRLHNTGVAADALDAQPLGTGVGLRLMIARQMARRLGGEVRVLAEDENGAPGGAASASRPATTVAVELPRAAAAG